MEFALPFIALVIFLLLGIPIAFALGGAGLLGIWIVKGDWAIVMATLKSVPFNTVGDYNLTTVPMFILMAFFSSSSGLARDLYTAASNWLSHIRGGLAIATVFACGIFGAMSGASVAAAAVMSSVAMPNMRRYGYSESLGAGSIGVGATLTILIPPSVPMVIYGVATQTSIGALLIAGALPGILLGVLLARLHSGVGHHQSESRPRDRSYGVARAVEEPVADLVKPAAHPPRPGASIQWDRHADRGWGRGRLCCSAPLVWPWNVFIGQRLSKL